ncbi:MAG: hypothetical protein KGI25_05930 [Thaumarchaeota archaeon]|nr:hypothetical protein [Nitrososphaerota archaeon]
MIGDGMIDMITQGKVTISVDGKPIISVDSNSKSFELEASGLEKANLKISSLFEKKMSKGEIFLESSHFAKKFAKKGWSFSLYDKGDRLLSTGSPSRFGTSLHFNPLKLRRILRIL